MIPPMEVQIQFDVGIMLRNGLRLSGVLYLPKNASALPAPAIVTMTPYIAQSHHQSAFHYASHGYPFLSVDVRGRGNSEGRFHPRNEGQDGYDIVEWLAQQPYCNGKVAMWGGSYLGRCQWGTAAQRPPHLATIVPVASPYYGVDVPLRKNVFVPYTVRWLTILAGRALQDKLVGDQSYWTKQFVQLAASGAAFRQFDRQVGNPSPLFQEWLAHPHRDAYWDSYEPTADQYSHIDVPVLTITGVYDGDQLGALEHYRRHLYNASADVRARHYLIIGPWDHGGTGAPKAEFAGLKMGPESLLDMPKLHREWYAWTLQGGKKPSFLQKNVAFYVAGLEKWRYAETLDGVTARVQPLYLDSNGNAADVFRSGSLSETPSQSSHSDRYRYDPRAAGFAEVEGTSDPESVVDQRMLHAKTGGELIYHSAPFTADTEVAGFFKLSVWLSIDRRDTDFRATVYEVGGDGGAIALTSDWLRARYRQNPREPKLIESTEPLRYDFDQFAFVARQIRKGSRLRLVVGPIDSIHWQKNYNSGGDVANETFECAQTVNVQLFHDREHPSALDVPIGIQS